MVDLKHKKGAADAKRGKVFSKLAKELTISARISGGDPGSNITLRTILVEAKAANMPADNIDRAIKKGTGALQSAAIEEILFEGYAPGGVGMIIQCLSDNRTGRWPRCAICCSGTTRRWRARTRSCGISSAAARSWWMPKA